MKTHRKILTRLTFLLRGILGLLLFLLAGTFVGAPTGKLWLQSHTLSAALSDARSVRIVEFTPLSLDPGSESVIRKEVILQRITPSREQIKALRAATGVSPVVLQFSIVEAGCFTPHHRVEVLRRDGSTFRFDVCFECNKFCVNGKSPEPIPASWLSPLRRFFPTSVCRCIETKGSIFSPRKARDVLIK